MLSCVMIWLESCQRGETLASGSSEMLIVDATAELSLQSLLSSVASRGTEPGSNP